MNISAERCSNNSLDDLLSDPLVRLVMAADHVDPDLLRQELNKITLARHPRTATAVVPPVSGATSLQLTSENPDRYRPGVGIVLLNAVGEVFVAQRIDRTQEGWQMPQGGIKPGEAPREAALRELLEEIGANNVEVLAESRLWLRYDLPLEAISCAWNGRWRGQQQKWFAIRFLGSNSEINLATLCPEFSAWRWAPMDWVPELIVRFKRPLYRDVFAELSPFGSKEAVRHFPRNTSDESGDSR